MSISIQTYYRLSLTVLAYIINLARFAKYTQNKNKNHALQNNALLISTNFLYNASSLTKPPT